MNYYFENLYYLMYADSKLNIKLKMRKSHAFYRIQLRSTQVVLLLATTFFLESEALPWKNIVINTTYLRVSCYSNMLCSQLLQYHTTHTF